MTQFSNLINHAAEVVYSLECSANDRELSDEIVLLLEEARTNLDEAVTLARGL